MKKRFKKAFLDTIPVLTGYLVLGLGFGIIMRSEGFGILLTVAMSVFIYAGSMQYAAIGLMGTGASVITVAATTLMVNARHVFYGISMLEKYKDTGPVKPYLIFSLTDETYSLVCTREGGGRSDKGYYLAVSLLNHIYWILGCTLGALVGSLIGFSTEGIDFALTALFVTVFTDQWLKAKNHLPAIIGVLASVICLIVFGADSFLIPSMITILVSLIIYMGVTKDE